MKMKLGSFHIVQQLQMLVFADTDILYHDDKVDAKSQLKKFNFVFFFFFFPLTFLLRW